MAPISNRATPKIAKNPATVTKTIITEAALPRKSNTGHLLNDPAFNQSTQSVKAGVAALNVVLVSRPSRAEASVS